MKGKYSHMTNAYPALSLYVFSGYLTLPELLYELLMLLALLTQ
jgi:hypothetical protein